MIAERWRTPPLLRRVRDPERGSAREASIAVASSVAFGRAPAAQSEPTDHERRQPGAPRPGRDSPRCVSRSGRTSSAMPASASTRPASTARKAGAAPAPRRAGPSRRARTRRSTRPDGPTRFAQPTKRGRCPQGRRAPIPAAAFQLRRWEPMLLDGARKRRGWRRRPGAASRPSGTARDRLDREPDPEVRRAHRT